MPEDYVFQRAGADSTPTDVRLSALFAPGKGSLVIYSMMFPCYSSDERPGTEGGQTALRPLAEGPCPSYTAFLDQLDGAAEPATQRVNFAVVAKAHCSASSPSPRSAAGGDCGSCPRPATATPGLPWRDPGRRPNADAERVPPRRRDDPPLLGLGAPLRAHLPRAGSPPQRHPRAALEPFRPHPRGTSDRLGRECRS